MREAEGMVNSKEAFSQFRQELQKHPNSRADATMELLDALSGNTEAKTPVELSLKPLFRRHYSTLYGAVEGFSLSEPEIWEVMSGYLPEKRSGGWWLLSSDVTPNPHPYAERLSDRGFVYAPQVMTSNKPVTIGHQYSEVVLLPEKQNVLEPPWVIPLSVRRVATDQDKELVAAEQMAALLSDPSLPFGRNLCVEVVDSSYSKPEYLAAQRSHPNLVTIARVRSNRIFNRQAQSDPQKPVRAGHPTWYGDRFALSDPATWFTPDKQEKEWVRTAKGRLVEVERTLWKNMLLRGEQKPTPLPMQLYPFSLVRIVVTTPTGEPLYRQPLWLLVMGEQRERLISTLPTASGSTRSISCASPSSVSCSLAFRPPTLSKRSTGCAW